jgi:hypothetical protein
VRKDLARQRGQGVWRELAGDGLGCVQVAHDHAIRQEIHHPRLASLRSAQKVEHHALDLPLKLLGQVGELRRQLLTDLPAPGALAGRHRVEQGGPALAGTEEVRQGVLRLGPGLHPHPL